MVGTTVGKGANLMARNRKKTKYPGVYFREIQRSGVKGLDEVYYIVFKRNGKTIEEKVGTKYTDNMTPAKASGIRSDRMQGKLQSRKEIREEKQKEKLSLLERPTLEILWSTYKVVNSTNKSIQSDSYKFNKYLLHLAQKTPDEIFTQDITALKASLTQLGKSPQTIRHIIGLVRRLIRFGAKQGLCAVPPLDKLYFEMPTVDNTKTEMLDAEQIIALENALQEEVDQNAAGFIRLALATGMRRGALMNLRWDDIDFGRGFITLRGDAAKKGKTESIPLNTTARKILESIDHIGGSLYVFPGKDGGPRKDFRRVARRVKIKAGLPEDFRPLHGLRHAYASLLASSGKVDLYTLQKLLTHSSPQMTQRYAHLADEAMQRAASVVDEILTIGGYNELY